MQQQQQCKYCERDLTAAISKVAQSRRRLDENRRIFYHYAERNIGDDGLLLLSNALNVARNKLWADLNNMNEIRNALLKRHDDDTLFSTTEEEDKKDSKIPPPADDDDHHLFIGVRRRRKQQPHD